jgi:hypothetical protein
MALPFSYLHCGSGIYEKVHVSAILVAFLKVQKLLILFSFVQ